MIKLSRLNDSVIVINCDMIEFIEETPDTVITLENDRKIIVKESIDDIIKKIISFRRKCKVLPGTDELMREEV